MIIRRLDNGDVVDEEGTYIGNSNDDDIEDKIDEYAEEWREVNWNTQDWAEHYGCSEDEVEDAMLDDCAWDWKMRILKVINGKEITEDEGGNISCNGLYIANIKDVDYMDRINKFIKSWSDIKFYDGDLYDDWLLRRSRKVCR